MRPICKLIYCLIKKLHACNTTYKLAMLTAMIMAMVVIFERSDGGEEKASRNREVGTDSGSMTPSSVSCREVRSLVRNENGARRRYQSAVAMLCFVLWLPLPLL